MEITFFFATSSVIENALPLKLELVLQPIFRLCKNSLPVSVSDEIHHSFLSCVLQAYATLITFSFHVKRNKFYFLLLC
jgi:hypothetical protein